MKLYHINPKTQTERRNYDALARSFQLPMFPDTSLWFWIHIWNICLHHYIPFHVNTNFSCPTTSRSETTHSSHLLHFTKAFKAQSPYKFYHQTCQIYHILFYFRLVKIFSVVFKFKTLYHEIRPKRQFYFCFLSAHFLDNLREAVIVFLSNDQNRCMR